MKPPNWSSEDSCNRLFVSCFDAFLSMIPSVSLAAQCGVLPTLAHQDSDPVEHNTNHASHAFHISRQDLIQNPVKTSNLIVDIFLNCIHFLSGPGGQTFDEMY